MIRLCSGASEYKDFAGTDQACSTLPGFIRSSRLTDRSSDGFQTQATTVLSSSAPVRVSADALSSSFSRVSLSSASAASCPGSNQVNSVNDPGRSSLSSN